MSSDIDTDDDVVLLCLRSSYDEAIDMQTLSSAGMSVCEFDDADELMEHLTSLSITEWSTFVWLGRGWNHLITILHELEQICYIYLSEPSKEKYIHKIRGVFTDVAELSRQVCTDARARQLNQSTHLEVFDRQETPVTGNQKGIFARMMWSRILLKGLLQMPRPARDVHREMLAEARHFYRNNRAQLAKIDDFEQNYQASDAIRWYSCDSFTYRLMNKALRIQNLAIIYKFRFFIVDVHRQLEKLHHKQNLSTQAKSGSQSAMKLYRAMQVSPNEVVHLRTCRKGAILSMNSFVSTSRKPAVAMIYLGSDPERDVLFEILIDSNLLNSDSAPFADISATSKYPEEEEVLLSMETILQVESVTFITERKMVYVHARLCYEEDTDVKELRTFIMKQFPHGLDEFYYINRLAELCTVTGDKERINQLMQLLRSSSPNAPAGVYDAYSRLADVAQYSNQLDDVCPYFANTLTGVSRLIQDLESYPCVPHHLRHFLSSFQEQLTGVLSRLNPETLREEPERRFEMLEPLLSWAEQALPSLPLPRSHPVFTRLQMVRSMIESDQGRHEQALSILDGCLTSSTVSLLNNDHMIQQSALLFAAESAAALGDEERSREILAHALSLAEPQPRTLEQLARHHERHGDLSMAIACYRAVIDDCKLPLSSLFVIQAYSSIGSAFDKIGNNDLAIENFSLARDLLLQHHPPSHPLLSHVTRSLAASLLRLQSERFLALLDRMAERR